MAARLNVEYERAESAISKEQKPDLKPVENLSEDNGIPCQKTKTRKKELTYVITEEDPVTDSERDYAEQMLYEAILEALKDMGALTAWEAEECRVRNQKRMNMKEI